MNGWSFYFPDDDEVPEDARASRLKRVYHADDVAQEACEHDYSDCDGWERKPDDTFAIAVIGPDGTETRFRGQHEPSVEHQVWEVKA